MRNRKYVFVITGAILLISLMFLKLFSLNYVYAMEETGEVDEVQIQVKDSERPYSNGAYLFERYVFREKYTF